MNLIFEKADNRVYDYIAYLDDIEIGEAEDNVGGPGSEFLIFCNNKIFKFSEVYNIADFFKEDIFILSLPINFEQFTNLNWIDKKLSYLSFEINGKIIFELMPNFVKWDRPYNVIDFLEKLKLILIPYGFLAEFKNNNHFLEYGFEISCNLNLDQKIDNEYERFLFVIDREVKNIFENPALVDKNSISNKYSFPQEIRQACEQYLIYFSKFLEDYGIEISSALESKDDDTFFTIMPKNANEALSNIRNLLNFYLSLPDLQNLEIITKDYNDVSVQQLLSNIYHLKSQLFLAHAIIESKNATIESLKFSNFQKQTYIEKDLKNEEKTLDGLITIQEFEYGSFKFNLPEVFRRLKRKFTK